MSDYTVLILVGLAMALVGLTAVVGLLSLNFGSHKKDQHPKAVWRAANSRAGLGMIVYGVLVAGASAIAGAEAPRFDNAFGAFVLVGAIIPLLAIRSGMKLLGSSRRAQAGGTSGRPG